MPSRPFSDLKARMSPERQANNAARTKILLKALDYNYRVEVLEGEYAGRCDGFPSLSFIDLSHDGALEGIQKIVVWSIEDMLESGESIPRAESLYRKMFMEMIHARQLANYAESDETRYITNLDVLYHSLTEEEKDFIESIPDTRCYACGDHLESITFGGSQGYGCKDCLANSRIELGIAEAVEADPQGLTQLTPVSG